jgi:putative ABC transport system substrate-binding protein
VLFAIVVALTMCGARAEAQQAAKVRKIGVIGSRPASSPGSTSEVIRRELRALGYVEGKNIAFEYRYTDGILDRLPAWLTSWSVSKLT